MDHDNDVPCPQLLVLDDGLLAFLVAGRRTPLDFISCLNKEGAGGCLSKEASKLLMEWVVIVLQEVDGKDGDSRLVWLELPCPSQKSFTCLAWIGLPI